MVLRKRLKAVYEAVDRCELGKAEAQTPEMCREAVERNPYELLFVKEQTPELCLEAVRIDGLALQWVKIPQTPEIYQAAVAQNPRAERYVKDKSMLLHPAASKNPNEP